LVEDESSGADAKALSASAEAEAISISATTKIPNVGGLVFLLNLNETDEEALSCPFLATLIL
jgi:hypothetical protein